MFAMQEAVAQWLNFKVSEKTKDRPAFCKVKLNGCHLDRTQRLTESHGQEHSISIDLHSLIFAEQYVLLVDVFYQD